MAAYANLSAQQLRDIIGRAPELPLNEIMQRIERGAPGGVATMFVPVHIITETTEVETSFHAKMQALKDKKYKGVQKKTYTKMVVVMDTKGQGGVLLFEDGHAHATATRMFDNALEIGKPFFLLPNR